MAYGSRYSSYRRPSRFGGGYRRSYGSKYRAGSGFVAKKYSRPVNGRSVPYYVGPGQEAHVFDSPINHFVNTATGGSTATYAYYDLLNPITRGTGIFERESQRASMKYLLIRLRCQLQGLTFPSIGDVLSPRPVTIRILLVYAPRALATIAAADFLTSPSSSTSDYASSAVQRIDSRENYQILYDNKFVLRQTSGAPTTAANTLREPTGDFTFKDLDLRLPIRRPVSFTASSVAPISLSDITSGSLHLVTLFDDLYASASYRINASIVGSVRLVFAP